jgi:hypothetical protein
MELKKLHVISKDDTWNNQKTIKAMKQVLTDLVVDQMIKRVTASTQATLKQQQQIRARAFLSTLERLTTQTDGDIQGNKSEIQKTLKEWYLANVNSSTLTSTWDVDPIFTRLRELLGDDEYNKLRSRIIKTTRKTLLIEQKIKAMKDNLLQEYSALLPIISKIETLNISPEQKLKRLQGLNVSRPSNQATI